MTNKVGRIVAECFIHPNKLYFVTLSSTPAQEGFFCETRLTINGKIEGSQSANEGIVIEAKCTTVGSEITSSMFKGLLSDLMILTLPFDLQEQKQFYENYWDYPNGHRSKELFDDQLIHAKINEKYLTSGCPKDLLKSFKYDESFKRAIQERRNYKEPVQTEDEIKARTDKSKAAKLERERIQKKIKTDVNSFIRDIRSEYPEYFEYLKAFVESRKWIFKSWNLYSPTIKKPGEPVLPFSCIHNALSKLNDLQCPFYGIEDEFFFRVLNMVRELNNELKRILMKFAEITETIYKHKELGIYIAYDRWLHYLCWAEELKPPKWVEKVEQDEEEEEEEDMSSSEEDVAVEDSKNKKPQVEDAKKFKENIFVGDRKGLKEKLKGFMHELNETAEEETGDIPKMYYENRKLHSFEVNHDGDRVQSIIFHYIVRTDEKTPWEEVMKEYQQNAIDLSVEDQPKDPKAKDDKAKDKQDKKGAPASTLYRLEQVKCFQEKLPEEETGKKDEKKDEAADLSVKKRYKFPDVKLMTRDFFKVLEAEKITFKTCDNKIFSIRAFYKDGRAHRLELNKHMSPEFERKRDQRLKEIEDAKKALAKQEEEMRQKEKEKKEREQKERRERRENRKNKEEFYKGPVVDETPIEAPPKIAIPELGEYDKLKMTWIPGKDCNFGMALINDENDLIGSLTLTKVSVCTRTISKP